MDMILGVCLTPGMRQSCHLVWANYGSNINIWGALPSDKPKRSHRRRKHPEGYVGMDQLDQYQISSGNQLHGLLGKPPFESMIFPAN